MKILFGVFDWGIGHATRDIPLIEELLKRKNEVHIISTGRALIILKKRFGKKCRYFDVPSLYYLYGAKGSFLASFIFSTYKLLKSLSIARKQSEKIIQKGNYEKIISDCRYDIYDRIDNSYLINHQLRFATPFGVERLPEKWLAKQMKNYKYIIVPDFKEKNLTGRLSHNLRYVDEKKIKYIGILSAMKNLKTKKDIDYFISLSGPEEQRKDLLKRILSQRSFLKGNIVIAGGAPENKKISKLGNIKFYSFINPKYQGEFMNRAKFLIIRAGYTTIMDLVELEIKKALLIPTPGQTEQEYLATYYEKNKFFHHISQYKLDLKEDIKKTHKFHGFKALWETKESVKKFMEVINS